MAMGFSNSVTMPNTDVVGCHKSDANTANAKDTFNPSYTNTNDGDHSTLTNFTFTTDGNAFSCEFNRAYLPQDSTKGFPLNGTYYIFSAIGFSFRSVNDPFVKHSSTPCISNEKIDPFALSNVTSSSPNYSLVQAHGLLMLLAWSVFITIGVVIAIFTKCSLPNGEWFHLHKFINLFGLIIALVGVALIFISLREWKRGSNTLWAHQLFGMGAILLMVTNPILAAFRCRPNAKYRLIFRIIHGVVGYSGVLLSYVAICLGLIVYYQLIGKGSSVFYGLWIFIAKLVTDWFFYIPLISYLCYKGFTADKDEGKKPLEKVNPFRLFLHNIFAPPQCLTGEDRKKPSKEWPIIITVLVAFVVYTLCFYTVMAVVIALAEQI